MPAQVAAGISELRLYPKEGAALSCPGSQPGRGAAILMSYARLLQDVNPVS